VTRDPSNLGKHAKTEHHKDTWASHGARQRQKLLKIDSTLEPVAPTGEKLALLKELRVDLRTATGAFCVGAGINPHMLSTAFGSTSLVPEALRLLHGHGVAFGAETTIRRDLAASFDDVARLVKDLVKDTVGSLVIDGATFKHMHSLGVMYESAWLDEPVLLGLIFAEPSDDELDGYTYDNVRCAADLRKICDTYSLDLKTQITCVMGDNVSFNACVARELGVALGKCIAHALALTAKSPLLSLPLVKTLVVSSSGLIYAGGGGGFVRKMREAGLNPRDAVVYTNRFASVIRPSAERLKNFDIFKALHVSAPIVACQDDDDAVDRKKRCDKVAAAYQEPTAKVALAIVGIIYESLPHLVEVVSSVNDHLPADCVTQLMEYREHLSCCSDTVIDQAVVVAFGERPTASQSRQALVMFRSAVQSACEAATALYDKHIVPMHDFLKKRRLYNPNTPVEEVPAPADIIKETIGCLRKDFGVVIKTQFRAYQADVISLAAEDKKRPPIATAEEWNAMRPAQRDAHIAGRYGYLHASKYWRSKLTQWPLLARIALWHLSFPTSSISIERVFAKMRMMGVPQRLSADNETFTRALPASQLFPRAPRSAG